MEKNKPIVGWVIVIGGRQDCRLIMFKSEFDAREAWRQQEDRYHGRQRLVKMIEEPKPWAAKLCPTTKQATANITG